MKYTYSFEEGRSVSQEKFGLKGASLCELYSTGLPIPRAFIISSDFILRCSPNDTLDQIIALKPELQAYITDLVLNASEQIPLLVSVRGSSLVSVPQWTKDPLVPASLNDVGLPESFNLPGE